MVTHEFGHAVGLDHQAEMSVETGQPGLTMSPEMGVCEEVQRSLGYGDIVSLRHHY